MLSVFKVFGLMTEIMWACLNKRLGKRVRSEQKKKTRTK